MSDPLLQELIDREAIKELKARYFRFVDLKDWDALRLLFADDAVLRLRDLDPIVGRDAIAAFVGDLTSGARTAHIAAMPEIAFSGPDEATAIWVLRDYLEWPADPETGARRGMQGYGHEFDTYRRVNGNWKIAAVEVSYLRRDSLSEVQLPDRDAVGSGWHRA